MKTSLVVLAAGMGSRFGGLKQLQPLTADGKVLLDFSIDDALSVAGIDSPELPILKQLVSITKNAKSGSISIIAVMDEDKSINQIEKLADKKINI